MSSIKKSISEYKLSCLLSRVNELDLLEYKTNNDKAELYALKKVIEHFKNQVYKYTPRIALKILELETLKNSIDKHDCDRHMIISQIDHILNTIKDVNSNNTCDDDQVAELLSTYCIEFYNIEEAIVYVTHKTIIDV